MAGLTTYGIRLAFLAIVYSAVVALLSAFVPTLPNELVNAIVSIFTTLQLFSFVIPLETLAQVVTTAIAFWSAMFLWGVIDWFITITRA